MSKQKKEFETLWPKLSALLETDLQHSLAFAQETRLRGSNFSDINYPVGTVYFPRRKDYELYMGTISKYSKPLAKEIQAYIEMSEKLLRVTNRYNELTYSDRTGSESDDAKKRMFDTSRQLEIISDNLSDEVRRRNGITPKIII